MISVYVWTGVVAAYCNVSLCRLCVFVWFCFCHSLVCFVCSAVVILFADIVSLVTCNLCMLHYVVRCWHPNNLHVPIVYLLYAVAILEKRENRPILLLLFVLF